jgi:hypothetical protein
VPSTKVLSYSNRRCPSCKFQRLAEADTWWHDENYSHGAILFVVAFILWQGKASPAKRRDPWLDRRRHCAVVITLWPATRERFVQRVSLVPALARVSSSLARATMIPLPVRTPIPDSADRLIAFLTVIRIALRCVGDVVSQHSGSAPGQCD